MKHLRPFIVMIALLGIALAATAHPVQRTVLVETFTNVSCMGCASANAVTQDVCNDLGNHQVLNLQYHTSWPEPNDPFYLVDPTDITVRTFLYEISSAPDLITAGVNMPAPDDYAALVAAVDTHKDELTPLVVVVEQTLVGTDLTVDVNVKAVDTPPDGDLLLHVAVVDEHEFYAIPPGDNGETDFHWSLRDMVPDHAGTTFTINEGDSLTFSLPSIVDPAWLDIDLHVIAWVQDPASMEVLQSATTAPRQTYAASYYAEHYGMVGPVDELSRHDGWVQNDGALSDTYDFEMIVDAPGWQVSACAGVVCYPPWVTEFAVTLAPGEDELIAIDITPTTAATTGTITMTFVSQGDRDVTVTRVFKLITPGADVLYVDADEGNGYDAYFTDTITADGKTFSSWDVKSLHEPRATDLAAFTKVVWNTEGASPALDDTERANLGAYLDGGGDLFLSGQDLAYDLCSANSPHQSYQTLQWYEHYTGATYVADDAQDSGIDGVAADPVGDGLSFLIVGGDGAGNQDYPDVIAPQSNARSSLDYSPGNSAGVRFGLGEARLVTLGFGFEGIGMAVDRNALMAAVIAWFDDTTVGAPAGQAPPVRLSAAAAHPNPFNPATNIAFTLEGDGDARTRIDIHDVLGRRVRHLAVGTLPAGDHAVRWDGRDDAGAALPGGLYLAIVRAGVDSETLKLTLVK